jgi:hypothetical protein
MSDLTYGEIVEITEADAQQAILDDLDSVGFTATAWQPFSIARLTVDIGGEIKSELSKVAVVLKKAFNITTAADVGDEAVEACASGQFSITKVKAVAAQFWVTVTVSATGGPYTVNPGDLVISGPTTDTYRLVDIVPATTFPLTLSSSGTYVLGFEAEVAGSRANLVDAASVDQVRLQIVTTLAGVSIASYTLTRSGVDDESNDRVVERCQLQWALLTAKNNIDEGVKAICLAASASIIDAAVDSSNPRGVDTYDVYLSGLDSTASDDDVALAQVALMRYELNKQAPLAKKSPEVTLQIAGVVYYSGIDEATLTAAVNAALLEFVRSVPPGGESFPPYITGVVRKDLILDTIKNVVVNGAKYVRTVTLTTPTNDFSVPLFGKVILALPSLTYQQLSS